VKELLTKKFWRDVKKTFDDARQDPPLVAGDSQVKVEDKPAEGAPGPAPNSPAVQSTPTE
jgi:hypothetical protein